MDGPTDKSPGPFFGPADVGRRIRILRTPDHYLILKVIAIDHSLSYKAINQSFAQWRRWKEYFMKLTFPSSFCSKRLNEEGIFHPVLWPFPPLMLYSLQQVRMQERRMWLRFWLDDFEGKVVLSLCFNHKMVTRPKQDRFSRPIHASSAALYGNARLRLFFIRTER